MSLSDDIMRVRFTSEGDTERGGVRDAFIYAYGYCHGTMSPIVRMHNHKGELTVFWAKEPTPRERTAIEEAWSAVDWAENKEAVTHVHVSVKAISNSTSGRVGDANPGLSPGDICRLMAMSKECVICMQSGKEFGVVSYICRHWNDTCDDCRERCDKCHTCGASWNVRDV